MQTGETVQTQLADAQKKANGMLKKAEDTVAASVKKIRDFKSQIEEFDRCHVSSKRPLLTFCFCRIDGRGFEGAPPSVNPEKVGKAQVGIRQVKAEKVKALESEKQAKVMAQEATKAADVHAEKERELTEKDNMKREELMEKDKLKAARKIAQLKEKDRRMQVKHHSCYTSRRLFVTGQFLNSSHLHCCYQCMRHVSLSRATSMLCKISPTHDSFFH